MEKIKPFRGKSSISSLKFQQKSDFKRFLNFIKNQTEELKGIAEPKENKVQGILGAGATGLGILGIGALLLGGGKGEGDDLETAKGLGGGLDLFAAIGRRNVPGINPSRPTLAGLKLPSDPRAKESINLGSRTSVTRGRSFAERSALKVNPGFAERRAIEKRGELVEKTEDLQKKRDIKKRYSENLTKRKELVKSGEVGGDSTIPDYMKKNIEAGKKIEKKILEKKPSIKINPLKIDPLKAFKSADEKLLADFMNAPDPEADALRDAASKTSPPPDVDDFFRGQKYLKNRKKPISRRLKNLREGVMGATDRDPSGRVTDTLSRKTFPEKSRFAKLTRMFVNKSKNPKITRDSFLGMSYKGPKLSMIAKVVNNPAVKVVLFGIDLLNTIRSGGQVFNPRDNLGTALYDLYVSINNAIFKDDPEKLKLYQSISPNERIMVKQVRRNAEIMRRQNEAVQKKFLEATGKGSNNIIVVPQSNNQGGGAGGGNTKMLSPTGGNAISFVPFEPLNIGDDILLHKLNQ